MESHLFLKYSGVYMLIPKLQSPLSHVPPFPCNHKFNPKSNSLFLFKFICIFFILYKRYQMLFVTSLSYFIQYDHL